MTSWFVENLSLLLKGESDKGGLGRGPDEDDVAKFWRGLSAGFITSESLCRDGRVMGVNRQVQPQALTFFTE
jgi:hypothetical protein